MRYLVKGGVWKNTEDEILKAAVMKYGLNQWSRIASLLVRKTPKQCKSRWYEWLDPSVKKTAWSREEDEKLLHLSKIFPTQWRTIAPLVGRTPTQCYERYEKLLDQAQGKDMNDLNDPRKLKPGEIDPNPESKPARPDPLHMDEDEKEMIAEARVRLVNTKGKKAKRLAREKLIEEARRLATLQKKRELRAAGIELKSHMSKKKKQFYIDYNNEVPFERKIPDYIFKTDDGETPKPDVKFQSMSYNQAEGEQRAEEERKFREIDKKRMKKLMDNDMEAVAEKLKKEQEKLFRNKTKLSLPAPQMLDSDLEMLGKLNQLQDASELQNQATKALVGNYSQREMPQTPMRTPMMQNTVMREAHNLVALQQTQTPLLGGENSALDNWENIKGLAPTPSHLQQTPSYLKQSLQGQQSVLGGSSKVGGGLSSQTPSLFGQTPLRDDFRINPSQTDNWDDQSQVSGLNEDKLQALRQQDNQRVIKEEIFNLPKPKNEFQIEIPDLEDEKDEEQKRMDAEDEERERYEQEALDVAKKQRLRSLTIQKNLPRPKIVPPALYDHIFQKPELPEIRRQAEELIDSEILNLISFDSQNFPSQGVKPVQYDVTLEMFNETELQKASKLIKIEMDNIKEELRHGNIDKQFVQSKWEDASNSIYYSKQDNKVYDLREVNKKEEHSILLEQANAKRDLFLREQKKLETLEKKLQIVLGGYSKLMKKNTSDINELLEDQNNLKITKLVYQELKNQEDRSVLPRLDELREYYARLEAKQANLQENYEKLLIEKQDLLEDQGLFQ